MIYRSRFEDIVFEFKISNEPRGTVILCDGLPSVPNQKMLMEHLGNNGYNVFFPRYRGTWESDGEFLAQPPARDIFDFLQFLKKGEVIELYGSNKFLIKPPFHIIGSSFGGTVALCLADNDINGKIITFSPIINFFTHNQERKEQDLKNLGNFIKKAFGNGYRFKIENWERMVKGMLFNPPENIMPVKAKKILIAYDKSDTAVDYKKIAVYAQKHNIKTLLLKEVGHLSFSKIPKGVWTDIFNFIDAKSNYV